MVSSGQSVTEFRGMRDCQCGFHGFADVWADPESRAGGWECPDCSTEHVNYY